MFFTSLGRFPLFDSQETTYIFWMYKYTRQCSTHVGWNILQEMSHKSHKSNVDGCWQIVQEELDLDLN